MSDDDNAPDSGTAHAGHGLSRKLGPLPVGVWVLAIGGGLIFAWYMRSHGSSAADTTTDSTDATTTDSTDQWPYGLPNGVGQADTGDDTGDTGDDGSGTGTAIQTNEDWQRRADSVLVGLGYEPTAVDRALGAYLEGDALTTVQRAIVNEAILRIGPPPISPPPPPTGDQPPPVVTPPTPTPPPHPPTPTPTPKPPPKTTAPKPTTPAKTPAYRTATITRPGQTLSDLVASYNKKYGEHQSVNSVWAFNLQYRPASTVKTLKARGPNKVYMGSTFWIPK